MRKIFYVVQKEFRQIRRTKAYLGLIFIAPFLELLIMGSALTNEVKHVKLAVEDNDHTSMSRELLDYFEASSSFDFVGMVPSQKRGVEMMDNGEAKLVLVVPAHFERDVENGRSPALQVLVDGVDGNSAGVALGYVEAVVAKVQQQWLSERGASVGSLQGIPRSISVVPRMWYNPDLDSKLNFVPGLIGILLIMMTTFLTAINIVREKEIGTLEQLMVTPLGPVELIIGKIIPFTVLGFAQLTMGVLAAGVVFGIWMKGSLLVLYAMVGIFCLSTLGLGIFVSTLARTQQQAMFIAWFIMIFMLLLSGFFVPIENMPRFIQVITYINPLRYFMTVLREVYLKGTEFHFMWREALAMAGIGVVALVSASVRFQKRMR